jgi:hypothetical protein
MLQLFGQTIGLEIAGQALSDGNEWVLLRRRGALNLVDRLSYFLINTLPMIASYEPNSFAQHFYKIITQIYLPPAGLAKRGLFVRSTGT